MARRSSRPTARAAGPAPLSALSNGITLLTASTGTAVLYAAVAFRLFDLWLAANSAMSAALTLGAAAFLVTLGRRAR